MSPFKFRAQGWIVTESLGSGKVAKPGDEWSPRAGELIVGSIYRYPSPAQSAAPRINGLPNWYWVTKDGDRPALRMEKGISGVAPVQVSTGGSRRPAVLIRSSPWKAGSFWTPWHDVFDLEHSRVRYFGDNKVNSVKLADETPGNKVLLQLALEHTSTDRNIRALSTPALVFRSVTVDGRTKGQVEFLGLAVIVGYTFVNQTDPMTNKPFDNYAFDLALLDLVSDAGRLDLRWIEARRSPSVTDLQAVEIAPGPWRRWAEAGMVFS